MTTSRPGILQTSSTVRITHKADYAVRAMTALAAEQQRGGTPVKREVLADREAIPPAFLDDILRSLRNGGLTASQRGAEGGWRLARPASEITVAEVIRAVEGPLAAVRGIRPHELPDDGVDETFVRLWVATRVALRSVLDRVTVADLARGRLPRSVEKLLQDPDAWSAR
jgi:Rrf2 family protein